MSNLYGPNFNLPDYRPNGQQARGEIKITSTPLAGDTITINGDVYTVGIDFAGENSARAMLSLAAAIRGLASETYVLTTDNPFKDYSAYFTGSAVVVFATAPGTAGNAYTLATNAAGRVTISGATLAGGTDVGLVTTSMGDFQPGQHPSFYSAETSATGATYVALADVVCRVVTLVNNTGAEISVQRDGAGTVFPLPDSTSKAFVVGVNANELAIRRTDVSNTQVTLYYEA